MTSYVRHGNGFKDITGERFGRLKVVGEAGRTKQLKVLWLCRCECGETRIIPTTALTSGNTKSCGCLKREVVTKHGHARHGRVTSEFWAWANMLKRCMNASHPGFSNYGGRGILVCDRWATSFEAFFEDMGPKPGSEYSIDRIDNDGGYSPENCRWATPKQQARNIRSNRRLTFTGETKTLSEWSEVTGIALSTIRYRLKHGWPIERALKTTVGFA